MIGTFAGGRAKQYQALSVIHVGGKKKTVVACIVVMYLLMLCGDIETNPGPNSPERSLSNPPRQSGAEPSYKAKLEQFRFKPGRQEDTRESDGVFMADDGMDQNVDESTEPQQQNVDPVLAELQKMGRQFADFRNEVRGWRNELNERIVKVEEKVNVLEEKLDDLENRSRRNNLLFFGITDSQNESWDDSEKKLKEFMKTKLAIPSEDADAIKFERVHRIGHTAGKRPIIAMFCSSKDKSLVYEKGRKLPYGGPVYIKQDYSDRVKVARRNLSPYYQKALQENRKPKIVLDKLIVQGTVYKYDSNTNNLCVASNNFNRK